MGLDYPEGSREANSGWRELPGECLKAVTKNRLIERPKEDNGGRLSSPIAKNGG